MLLRLLMLMLVSLCTAGIAHAKTNAEPDLKEFLRYYSLQSKIFAGLDSKPKQPKNAKPIDRQKTLLKLGLYYLNKVVLASKDNQSSKKKYLNLATNYFRRAIKINGEQEAKAQAMLHLAMSQSLLGSDNSLFYYRKLRRFSRSELNSYANLAHAEHLYAKKHYRQAERLYKKSVAYRHHPSYPYSVYKLAWLYKHLAKSGNAKYQHKAINSLKLLIKISERNDSLTELQRAAFLALADIWSSSADGSAMAKSYFTNTNAKQYYYLTLENIARKFAKRRQYKQAIDAYKNLLSEAVSTVDSPRYLNDMLNLLRQAKQYQDMTFYLRKAEKIYFDSKSAWQAANKSHPQRIYWMNYVEDMIYNTAKDFYALGTQTANISMFTYARNALLEYLKISHNDTNIMHAKFLLAEILFEFKYYDQAAAYYHDVQMNHTLDQELANLAGISAIKSLKKIINEQLNLLHDSDESARIATEQRLKKIILTYLNIFTNQHEKPLLLDVARLELKHLNFHQAEQHLKRLVAKYSKSQETAAGLSDHLLALEKEQRWQDIIAWVDDYLKQHRSSMPDEVSDLIVAKYRLARLNHGLDLHNSKKHAQAAPWLQEYQRLFPDDEYADYSLLLAGDNYRQNSNIGAAIDMYKTLIETYPNSKSYNTAVNTLALIHEQIGDFEVAAEYYLIFGRSSPRDNFNELEKSMRLFSYLHMYDKARSVAQLIATKFNSLPSSFYRQLSDLYFKMGNYDNAWQLYKEHLVYTREPINLELIDVLKSNGELEKLAFIEQSLSQRKLTKDERHLLAKIKFIGIQDLIDKFMLSEVSNFTNPDQEIKSLQSEMLKIVAAITEVVNIGDDYYKAKSLYTLGELYQGFSSIVSHSLTLTDNNSKQRTEIEKIALLLMDEANKYYQASYDQAISTKQFNSNLLLAYDKISQANPNKYPTTLEKSSEPLYFAHEFYLHKPTAALFNYSAY